MRSAKKSKTSEWGLTHAVEALSYLEGDARRKLMDKIRQMDPEVAEAIDQRMFKFEDLCLANDRGLSELLGEVKEQTLLLALRGAGPKLLQKVFGCFSQRKQSMIQEGLTDMGPQPRSKVEEAQAEIIKLAKQKITEGTLIISSGSDPLV